MHSHGKTRFSNAHVDLETLRPARPEGARLLVLPNLNIEGATRQERVTSLRDQIRQVCEACIPLLARASCLCVRERELLC